MRGDMIEAYKIISEVYGPEASPSLKLDENRKGTGGHKFLLFKEGSQTERFC